MTRKNALTAIAAVSLLATLLAACGSSATRLSSSDFKAKFAALCKTRDKATSPYLDQTNIFSMQEGAKNWPKAKGVIVTFIDDVKDLNPPKADEGWVNDYLDQGDVVLADVDKVTSAAKAGDQKPYSKALGALFEQFSTIDKPTADHGIKGCYDPENNLPPAQKAAAGSTGVTVGAKEYAFDVPTGIKAGKTAFKLQNNGNEMHVLGLSKLKPGVTFDQVKAKIGDNPEPDLSALTDDVGVSSFAVPDDSTILNADLEPGTYVAFCFLPSPSGKSHFLLGMLQPFDVS